MMSPSDAREVLVVTCDCDEDDCATRLELPPDGILAIEDKDGLLVTIMLPGWLEDVMRTAIAAHAPGPDVCDTTASAHQTAWPAPTVEEPALETLVAWMDEGICDATDGCICEPDGMCAHGHPSWFLKLGFI